MYCWRKYTENMPLVGHTVSYLCFRSFDLCRFLHVEKLIGSFGSFILHSLQSHGENKNPALESSNRCAQGSQSNPNNHVPKSLEALCQPVMTSLTSPLRIVPSTPPPLRSFPISRKLHRSWLHSLFSRSPVLVGDNSNIWWLKGTPTSTAQDSQNLRCSWSARALGSVLSVPAIPRAGSTQAYNGLYVFPVLTHLQRTKE